MIGCGSVAITKSGPSYQLAPGSVLAAVASRRRSAAADYASKSGISMIFDDPAELICSPDIDAVYVATPPASHIQYALQAAKARKPCCVEKPMALSGDDARKMVKAFQSADRPLFVAYYRRSLPRFVKVREWLLAGAIGQVRHVTWTLLRSPSANDVSGASNWRTHPDSAPGGYFDDLACHGLDLVDYLLGPISTASGIQTNQGGFYTVSDAFSACWLHESGVTGIATWNFVSPFRRDIMTIVGSSGEISLSVFDECKISLESPDATQSFAIANPDPIQLNHVKNMIASLKTGAVHPSTGESALRTAYVMDAILSRKCI
jgi:predicted dehydrogenase